MSHKIYDIAVIGGGASGMMAALEAKRQDKRLKIIVLERMSRLGKKLMATGNGRCNITNVACSPQHYHGDVEFMQPVMSTYPPESVIRRFEEYGVKCKIEAGGRVYPCSDQASSVLDCLRLSMEEREIQSVCDFTATKLSRHHADWLIESDSGETILAHSVILASGGLTAPSLGGHASGYALLQSAGHAMTLRVPGLVQLKTDPRDVRALKGIKLTCEAGIFLDGSEVRRVTDEVLFTDYGLSGPAIMLLSRWATIEMSKPRPRSVTVRLKLVQDTEQSVYEYLVVRRRQLSRRRIEDFLTGYINKRVGQVLVRSVTDLPFAEPASELTDENLKRLSKRLVSWDFTITGSKGFDAAQVTAGGAKCDQFDPHTLESLLSHGLFACGEVLNVDGDCGGYNLQWAWASGMTAGTSAADYVSRGGREKEL
ncbi:MAG: aminoacetone oxidase family FAD-binding enzyme [Clostridia bacterium]|nr:aminoacetone oxidase family FAD-binding enzyme [Clostridia bacterium]